MAGDRQAQLTVWARKELGATGNGEWLSCLCPLHDDSTASGRISSISGKYVCQAVTCGEQLFADELADRLGLTPPPVRPEWAQKQRERSNEVKPRPGDFKQESEYVYHLADGTPHLRVKKLVAGTKKKYPQSHRVGDSWKSGLPAKFPHVLFHLPELLASSGSPVVITEGEKDVLAAERLGLVATTSPGGAGKAHLVSDWGVMSGRDVVVIADNDTAGQTHADQVANLLLPFAKSVRVLTMPGVPPKGDLSDWIALGGTAAGLRGLIESAPTYRPNLEESAPAEDNEQGSAFKRLLDVAEKRFTFFSDNGFGYLSQGSGRAIALASKAASDLLLLVAYEALGKPPTGDTLTKVLDLKRAQVNLHGPSRPVFRRVGFYDQKHYLDLCRDGKVVEITAEGWSVIDSPPGVYFLRAESQYEALPDPIAGGDVRLLGRLVNAPEPLLRLLIVWLAACLRTGYPYVILDIEGESGSGKSTAAKVLKYMIDPARSLSRGMPPSERDLAIASLNSHILAIDNIDKIKPEQSDQLCRCATGCSSATRSHYTMTEETVVPMHSPVILTGIEGVVERADMASRVALVTLEPPAADKRLTEAELWPLAEELRPAILGGLLDAMVAGLRHFPEVSIGAAPRMVDFARFAVAAERGLPWAEGEALQAFREAQADLNEQALGKDRVALAVVHLLERRRTWEGTMSDLLGDLIPPTVGENYWPTTAHALSRRVKQALPLLRARGIAMVENRSGRSRSYVFSFASSMKWEKSVTSVTDISEARSYANGVVTLPEKIASQSVTLGGKASPSESLDEIARFQL